MMGTTRTRIKDARGLTLVELLVVIVIIGILAALAIPLFLNERGKAVDASAKSAIHAARTAIETYATDHDGDYSAATVGGLQAIEPALNDPPADTLAVTGASASAYTLTVTASPTNRVYAFTRSGGSTMRTCTVPSGDRGGCPSTGTW